MAPAVFDSGFAPEMTLADRSRAPIEVAITPARIEVVGAREPNVAWALPQSEPCRPQGCGVATLADTCASVGPDIRGEGPLPSRE